MSTRLSQADTLDGQQLARKCEIRDSWISQERRRRQRVSKLRQQWLADVVVGKCPQHITPRWTSEEVGPVIANLKARVAELEEENTMLRRSAFVPQLSNNTELWTLQGELS